MKYGSAEQVRMEVDYRVYGDNGNYTPIAQIRNDKLLQSIRMDRDRAAIIQFVLSFLFVFGGLFLLAKAAPLLTAGLGCVVIGYSIAKN